MKSVATNDFQMRSIDAAHPAIEGGPRPANEPSWIRERTPPTDPVLLDATLTWMARLPKEMRPMALARSFPRIANDLASLWRRVARCEEYLDALVVDRRGDRTGFPPEVARELNNLRGFYADLHPANSSGWNQVGASA